MAYELNTDAQLLGRSCLVQRYPGSQERDLILVGKYGAIWQFAPDRYFVLVDSSNCPHRGVPGIQNRGDETGRVVGTPEALEWIGALKVPLRRDAQLRLAARFAK